jgi:uncharacterized protein
MIQIKRSDFVYNISHNDLDGIGCNIVLSNVFSNINYSFWPYVKVDECIKFKDFSSYKNIIMTDITPSDKSLLDKYPIILLDHHDSVKDLHDITKNRFISDKTCATLLVKRFFEKYFNVNLSHLDKFCFLVNDYDLWIHSDPMSKKINTLINLYKNESGEPEEFRNRFMKGDVELKSFETDYIEEQNKAYQNVINDLEVLELETIKGCCANASDFINDVGEHLLKCYNICFIKNKKNNFFAIRHNIKDFNAGEWLAKRNYGGGHPRAAGMTISKDLDHNIKIIFELEKFLYDNFVELRR